MNAFSAKSRIVLGLGCLLFSVLLVAFALGLAPDQRAAAMDGRAALCEALAFNSSALVGRRDVPALKAALHGVVERNPELLSAAVRRADGTVTVEIGDHLAHWSDVPQDRSNDTQVQVPLWVGDQKWGSVELRFEPLGQAGLLGLLKSPWTRFILFVTAATLLTYMVYLGRVLEQLDPSKVVPGRVRAALNTLAEGLIVLDRSGRIVLANDSFARLVGKAPEKLVGVTASRLPWIREGSSAAAPVDPWTVALRDERPMANVTMRLRAADGSDKTFAANCSPVLGHQGTYNGVLASFDDVTQLEQHKHDLRKSKEEAELANRAKSDFLARMSHEIRTPMNAILGFTEVLQRGFDCNAAERQEYLNSIYSSGQHLLSLINDILDLSKVEAGKLELEQVRTPLVPLIADVVSVMRVRAQEKGIVLEHVIASPVPETILIDPVRVQQMLMNLVANAIKFTDTGGVKVVVRVELSASKPTLVVEVIDTGIGIAPDAMARIFEPFSQADSSITRRFGGTGLGLTICRRIADAMGATLLVQSEVGVGSIFTLAMDPGPLADVPMLDPNTALRQRRSETRQDPAAVRLSGVRVLAVDDAVENRKLLTLVLGRAGAIVKSAVNGQDAVALAATEPFDIVLMDVEMPVLDGYAALEMLRQHGIRVPVLALTAHAMKGDREKCQAAGFTGYIAKPLQVDELLQTLAAQLSGRIDDAQPVQARPAAVPEAEFAAVATTDFDQSTESLVSTLPMDDPVFFEIVQEFVENLDGRITAMAAAAADDNMIELAHLAHWLRGSGGTVGFDAFTEPARRLEQFAKQQRREAIPAVLRQIEALAQRIVIQNPTSVRTPPSESQLCETK